MYRIRLDIVNDLNTDDLLQVCDASSYVVVRHELPHGNPHFHAWIQNDIKDTTLRQRFKRKFPDLKPSDYSIKKCDPERKNEFVQYMFNTKHGNKWELIDTLNFDDQLLNDLIKAAKEISDDYKSIQQTKQRKGPTIWDIAQEVETEVQTKMHNKQRSIGNGRAEDFTEDVLAEEYKITIYTDTAIQILRKHKKAFDEFLLRKVISTAMSSTEYGKDKLRKKMIKNFTQMY